MRSVADGTYDSSFSTESRYAVAVDHEQTTGQVRRMELATGEVDAVRTGVIEVDWLPGTEDLVDLVPGPAIQRISADGKDCTQLGRVARDTGMYSALKPSPDGTLVAFTTLG